MFQCHWPYCQEGPFTDENAVYQHVIRTHATTGYQVCKWQKGHVPCDTPLKHRSHFIEHVVSHFSLRVRPYVCTREYCRSTFRSRQRLALHTKKHHSPSLRMDMSSNWMEDKSPLPLSSEDWIDTLLGFPDTPTTLTMPSLLPMGSPLSASPTSDTSVLTESMSRVLNDPLYSTRTVSVDSALPSSPIILQDYHFNAKSNEPLFCTAQDLLKLLEI